MEEFRKLTLLEKRKMAIEDLVKYYSELRKYEYKNGQELKHINLRKRIHFLISFILKIDQLLSREKIVVLNDIHTSNTKKPAYLMLGDPGILYKKLIYQGLKMNGVIPLETKDREDRKIAYNRSIELLKKGGNLLIYPEGAWNVTPNLVVMKLFTGTVRLAQETGSEIIPIAVEQYGQKFYFNIGANYEIAADDSRSQQELTDDLRDKLATLKWELMLVQPKLKREEIPDNYLEQFQNEIVGRCNYGYGFSLEDAISESFHDKSVISEEEVFSFLENIEINKNNAFLMKDKLKLTLRR